MVVVAAFGGLTAAASGSQETSRVFVAVDSSFSMSGVWSDVDDALDEIGNRNNAEFYLVTEKQEVHGWQPDLMLSSRVEPVRPCDLSEILNYPAIAEADERILVTTEAFCDQDDFDDWTVVLVEP